jgi:hypothetical protein
MGINTARRGAEFRICIIHCRRNELRKGPQPVRDEDTAASG